MLNDSLHKMLMHTVMAGVVLLASGAAAYGQQCLHGGTEDAPEAQRRLTALSLARQINTAENALFRQSGSFAELSQIASEVGRHYATPLVMQDGTTPQVVGFRVNLLIGKNSYQFSIRDTTDPCRFTYFGDNSGVIFVGYPIDSPVWRERNKRAGMPRRSAGR